MAVVAPIFPSGEGVGFDGGCTVASPPIFLAEDEALKVIRDELDQAGIKLSAKNVSVGTIIIPPHLYFVKDPTGGCSNELGRDIPPPRLFLADLADPHKHVAIEFVSLRGNFELGKFWKQPTARYLDFKTAAARIASLVKQHGRGFYFGAFYDPAGFGLPGDPRSGRDSNDMVTVKRALNIELLREQVKGFVEWLKFQGAI